MPAPIETDLTVRVVTSESGFSHLQAAWEQMVSASSVSPFQSYQWVRAWWHLVGSKSGLHDLEILVVERHGVVRGLAPLMLERGAKTLRFLGDPWADYLDVVIDSSEDAFSVSTALVGALKTGMTSGRYRSIVLDELPEHSSIVAVARADAQLRNRIEDASVCPILSLEGAAYDLAVGKREYLIKRRRLRRMGQLECHVHTDPDAIAKRVNAFMQMHLRQWFGREDRGLSFDDHVMRRFYRNSIGPLGRAGLITLFELRLDDKPIGFYYGYLNCSCFFGYRPTHDTGLNRFSPGGIMHLEIFEWLWSKGFKTFDFMRGDMAYKWRYASDHVTNQRVIWTS
ncbi:GNAT family N-acetyltransferase [Aestuariivita sp.]|jgi:CelD/BcsL family acetyltransferase involved in cellulose biosynthesis|uniref:GNAT family N-acetyltransferase n=1 Tax=Aestuariivita sp. TaxID=1872407 RepID=UPI00217150DF|nr:GNAT family N-acetyltransferase [Aestuariivita sp.]MCE8008112.1 GNAT family N-acetyltransferase [Aestuariivita sp.]